MGATANEIFRRINSIQNQLIELRALLADLEIGDSEIEGEEQRPRTGWKLIRGTHSVSHVRDPNGTDRPPTWTDDRARR